MSESLKSQREPSSTSDEPPARREAQQPERPGRAAELIGVMHAVSGVSVAVYAATGSTPLTVATLLIVALLGRWWITRGP